MAQSGKNSGGKMSNVVGRMVKEVKPGVVEFCPNQVRYQITWSGDMFTLARLGCGESEKNIPDAIELLSTHENLTNAQVAAERDAAIGMKKKINLTWAEIHTPISRA